VNKITMRRALLCLALLQIALPVLAQTQSVSPAERQAKSWLDAFNSGDHSKLLEFLKQNRPSAVEHIDDEIAFRERTGGFTLIKPEESTPGHFVALLKEKDSDQFARIDVEVAAEPPYQITKLELRAIPRPTEFAIPRVSEKEAVAQLRQRLEQETAADRFSGSVLVAQNGTIVFEHAYGMADREKKIPNELGTKFRIGSMNKMFTAVSILQLAEAGKIRLDDPVGKYLPDYPNKEIASKVTIHDLLTHTGGTGDIFGPEFEQHRLELRTLQDYVNLYGQRGPEFDPGSRFAYSNYGFLLLGVIVEKVSGQSYYDYVREHIFKPAGMTSTDSLPENEAVANRSIGYMKPGPGPWRSNVDTLPYRGTSAGGGCSTVEDLYRFAMALQADKLLDAKHTELLITGKVETGRGDKYAYGFFERDDNGLKCFGHGGGAPGMNGDLKICPESGYVIAVLANLDPPAAQNASEFVGARLPLK